MINIHFEAAGGPSDAQAFKELRLQAIVTDPGSYLADPTTEAARTPEEWQRHLSAQGRTVILGYADAEPTTPVSTVTVDVSRVQSGQERSAVLSALYVRPSFRRGGIGSATVAEGEAIAQQHGATVIRATTLHRNPGATSLFGKAGYEITETRLINTSRVRGLGELVMEKRI